jgi:urease accessory protein
MNGRYGILRGSGVPSPIPVAASPPRYSFTSREQMLDAASLSPRRDDTDALDAPARSQDASSDRDLQRADGSCRIVLGGSRKGTRIVEVYQQSPVRVLFPRTAGSQVEEAVLVNTSGGVAGGDHLQSSVTAFDDASITVTTQAAEKVYRALDESAFIRTTLKACDSARVAWLPQETIVFNRARVSRQTEIEISSASEVLALEWLVLGRAAHGETMSAGSIVDSWRVRRNGRLVWADTFRATDEVFPHLSRKALLSDGTVIATLVYFGPKLETDLQFIREHSASLACHCAATLVGGLLVVRFAAESSWTLKIALRALLQELGKRPVPGPFRVPKMWSC